MNKYLNFLLGDLIKGPKNFDLLVGGTYILGVSLTIIMLVIALVISNSILSNPEGTDRSKRKKVFWITAFIAPVIFTLYNFILIIANISSTGYVSKFQTTLTINFFVMLILYILLGFILSFIFKNNKIGDWFFANKKYKN